MVLPGWTRVWMMLRTRRLKDHVDVGPRHTTTVSLIRGFFIQSTYTTRAVSVHYVSSMRLTRVDSTRIVLQIVVLR